MVKKKTKQERMMKDVDKLIKEHNIKAIAFVFDNDSSSNYSITIQRSKVYSNERNGVFLDDSTGSIVNSEIYDNGGDSTSYYGIKLLSLSSTTEIRNCTIIDNANEGIYRSGGSSADVSNCIIRDNNNNDIQLGGVGAYYNCCITDPNDLQGTDSPDEDGNITCAAGFAYPGVFGNYHLASDSICIGKGDAAYVVTGELDIDGQDRIYDTTVEIGADEVACTSGTVSSVFDENGDGVVNYAEFAVFGDSWGMTTTDPNWSDTHSNYDFDEDDTVEIDDLAYWADEWLWTACWLEGNGSVYDWWMALPAQQSMMMGMESSMLGSAEPVENAIDVDEVMRFMEIIADEMLKEKAIKKKDLKCFLSAFQDYLYDNKY